MQSTRIAACVGSVLFGSTAACAGAGGGSAEVAAPVDAGERRVPQLVVGLAFPGRDTAPERTLSAARAMRLRAEIRAEGAGQAAAEGRRGWFFHAFDGRRLKFMVGRFQRRCARLGCHDYVIESIVVVPRSDQAARDLEVAGTIALYEEGVGGVRGDMTPEEVRRVLGEPTRILPLQYVGSARWDYPTLSIVMWADRVADIHPPRGP